MLQTVTESAQIWLGTINIDLESRSRRVVKKRRLNSRAFERFRQRKKAKMEEMQETIERLTKECDYLRCLCHRLGKSREAEIDSIFDGGLSQLRTLVPGYARRVAQEFLSRYGSGGSQSSTLMKRR
ncbi:hypothetical protein AJ78_08756 [Emergomyces pasteurianus Ep9510]|uniref:BZIP domain-containing protein n=1 Tax=Emergomyces pasteurianus Ep9510 TaxID=1447872 RepID=A0A1J9NZV4_9EURO|nr:hypothetical protein AJ78_08756 [Emergomyces pasteurianus Ep9510]